MVINSYDTTNPENVRQTPEIGLLETLEISGGEKVIDIGCGIGNQSYILSKTSSEVLGIDLQAFMIDYAKENRNNENIVYLCEDFMKTDFPEDYYDIVICQNVMFHIEDKEVFLKKVYKLLKRGGQFAFTDLTSHVPEVVHENLAYPVPPNYYTVKLNQLGFTNIMFYFEKHWKWDDKYSGKNYTMFKCSK